MRIAAADQRKGLRGRAQPKQLVSRLSARQGLEDCMHFRMLRVRPHLISMSSSLDSCRVKFSFALSLYSIFTPPPTPCWNRLQEPVNMDPSNDFFLILNIARELYVAVHLPDVLVQVPSSREALLVLFAIYERAVV